MRLKKKVKVFIIGVILILTIVLGFAVYKTFFPSQEVKEAKVISKIDDFGYTLKDNKNSTYHKMFKELKAILNKKEIDYEAYASKIAEMFIYDFYSLEDKSSKNDIGGVEFIYPDNINNFIENAQNTYYKYIESNVYGNRNQSLPLVKDIVINSIEKTTFTVGNTGTMDAYALDIEWNYTTNSFSDYQKSASVIIVHKDKKLYIVEVK